MKNVKNINNTSYYSTKKLWYVKRPGLTHGPFSHFEIIQMLQEKIIYSTDSIRKKDSTSWVPISELSLFQSSTLSDLKEHLPEDLSGVFFKRQHARANYGCTLIVHDSKSVFKGESLQISAGGAGFVVQADHLQPGHTLLIHFQPGGGVPPFNAVCKVVSKRTQPLSGIHTSTNYGVAFTSISSTVREKIKHFAEAAQQEAAA